MISSYILGLAVLLVQGNKHVMCQEYQVNERFLIENGDSNFNQFPRVSTFFSMDYFENNNDYWNLDPRLRENPLQVKSPIRCNPKRRNIQKPITTYQASLLNGDAKVVCTSTIVTGAFLITSAACVQNFRRQPWQLKYRVGQGPIGSITDVFIHPQYDGHNFDLAVLKTKENRPGGEVLRLPLPNTPIMYSRTEASINFGNNLENFKKLVRVTDGNRCLSYRSKLVRDNIICILPDLNGKCRTLPGSPLTVGNMLVGVLHSGSPCGRTPAAYTSIQKCTQFIVRVMQSLRIPYIDFY